MLTLTIKIKLVFTYLSNIKQNTKVYYSFTNTNFRKI